MALRALLFDLGDTLWQATVPAPAGLEASLAARQLRCVLGERAAGVDLALVAAALLDATRAAQQAAAQGSLLSPDFCGLADQVIGGFGLADLDDRAAQVWRACCVPPERLGRQVFPDAYATLAWARAAGFRIGAVVNHAFGAAAVDAELRAANLREFFDAVTVSADAGWLKPHPELFFAALAALGVVPEEAVMVGDSLSLDVKGAMMIGMTAVWKRNGRRVRAGERLPLEPAYQIDDLSELPRLLGRSTGSALPIDALGYRETGTDRYA